MQHKQKIIAAAVFLCLAPGLPTHSYATSKKLKKANARYAKLEAEHRALQAQYAHCTDSTIFYRATVNSLSELLSEKNTTIKEQKANNEKILGHLQDLALISGSQAESINRFLETIGSKDAYIRDLQSAIARRDSITIALAMNLKSAVGNIDDKDINIKIDKGVIYIDISDKMLFRTGKYQVASEARIVLGKVAQVLLAHPEIEFMIEGHTDNVPYREGVLVDNWDLSVKRATSVARILQGQYDIPPARITAAGRGEYMPVASNETPEGRARNRRTRIIILPQFEQFYQLLQKTK